VDRPTATNCQISQILLSAKAIQLAKPAQFLTS
jgi:hypothetical protein